MNRNYLSQAIQMAIEAGACLRKGFGSSFSISFKEGSYNLVTTYDKKSEEILLTHIQKHFPQDGFLAEESGASPKKAPVQWIIDPLDGTVNFARTIPIFSVSIAVVIENAYTYGVVYQPITKELFIAEKGKGAYLHSLADEEKEPSSLFSSAHKLSVSSAASWKECFLATGFPYQVAQNPLHCVETFGRIAKKGVPLRRLGSAAIDLAYVAAGRFDGFWEVVLEPWDIGAGKLLVEEAGGRVTRYDGTDIDPYQRGTCLASNGYLHSLLQQELSL